MSYKIKILKFNFFIILFFLPYQTWSAEKELHKYHNYHFIYEQNDRIFVGNLISEIKGSLTNLENFFGRHPKSIITIFLTKSQSEYDSFVTKGVPEWSQAVTLTQPQIIILKVDSAPSIKRAPQILLHEMVHLFFAERYPVNSIPVWLNEGIAQYLSGYELTIDDKIRIANALYSNNILALQEIDSLLNFNQPKALLGYTLSQDAVEYFIQQHGLASLPVLLDNFAVNRSVNTVFKKTIGYDFIDFELHWYENLQSKYKWLILLNLENIIWISMVLLAIMAIIVIRIRNRRIIKNWEDEDPFIN